MVYDLRGNRLDRQKTKHVENVNRLNPTRLSIGWVNTTLGGDDVLTTANSNTRTTEAISVEPGQIVSIGYIDSFDHNPFFISTSIEESCLAYAFFNSAHKVVSGETSRPNVVGGIEVPNNAAYIRVTFYDHDPVNHPENFYVYVGSSHITSPTYWFENDIETISPDDSQTWQMWGKTWMLFGDSLTDSYGGHGWDKSTSPVGGIGWKDSENRVPWTDYFWASAIARQLGLIIDNRGQSGSNMNVGNNGNYANVCGVNILNTFLSELENGSTPPDYITVGFGTNAIASQLGTNSDDSTVTTSTYGAVKYFIEKIREKCPYTALGFILPPPGDWTGISTVKNIDSAREAIRTVCEDYKVPYVDMNSGANIVLSMLPDKIHVSSIEANSAYMHAMRDFLLRL